jgi:hypothetical protein
VRRARAFVPRGLRQLLPHHRGRIKIPDGHLQLAFERQLKEFARVAIRRDHLAVAVGHVSADGEVAQPELRGFLKEHLSLIHTSLTSPEW